MLTTEPGLGFREWLQKKQRLIGIYIYVFALTCIYITSKHLREATSPSKYAALQARASMPYPP